MDSAAAKERYDDAFAKELAGVGRRAIAFVQGELAKASKPCDAPDVALVLQSAIIDHLEDDYTRHAHPTRSKADITLAASEMLEQIGEALIDHARKMAARVRH